MSNAFDQFDAKSGNAFDQFDTKPTTSAQTTPGGEQQPLSWSDVPGKALSNLPSSAGQNIKAMAQPFIHPIETAENLGSVALGGLQKAGIAPGESFEPYADALVDFYKKRYGSVEGLKQTIANDPVGALADLSMVFSGGETALARLPGSIGEIGTAAGQVSRATNPVNLAAKAIPAAGRATGLIGDADRAAAGAQLAQAGVLRTPGQRVGGAFKTLEDAASSIPILGSFISGGRKTSVESFNQAVANQALEPIGQATKAKAGHALVQDVEEKLGNAYDQLLPNLRFSPDGDFIRDLTNIRNDAKANMTGDRARQFDSIVQARLPAASHGTIYTGEEYKGIESQLKTLANGYRSSADQDQRMLGQSLDKVVDAMKSGLERNNPAWADQLSNINYGWAMYARMRAAASRRTTSEGVFTPNDLLSAVKGADKSVGKGTFAKGNALMQTFAEAGQKVLPSELPTSGTVERGLHAGALLGGSSLLASPHLLAAGAAAAAPYTKLGMKATDLASRLPYGAAARTALPAGRLGEAASGQYGFAKGGAVEAKRPIMNLPHSNDGLLIEPAKLTPEIQIRLDHNRDRFAKHFNYADEYGSGDPNSYDAKGDYNCGRCNQAQGRDCLLIKKDNIDMRAGSCRQWESIRDGDPEMFLQRESVDGAAYGVAKNGQGFGCHRCPYSKSARNKDDRGRTRWCALGGFHQTPTACCGLNGAQTIDDKPQRASGGRVNRQFHPKSIGGRRARDGQWYLPSKQPGKWLRIIPRG